MRTLLLALLFSACATPPPPKTPKPDWAGERSGLFMDGQQQAYRALGKGKSEKAALAAALDDLRLLADCHVERLEDDYRALTEARVDKAEVAPPDECGVSYPDEVGRLHVRAGYGPLARKVQKLAGPPEVWRGDEGALARVEVTRAALDEALIDDDDLSPKLRVFVHAQAVKAWEEEAAYFKTLGL